MKALFVHDTYYSRSESGFYAHGAFPYVLWAERFLPHFETLKIIGRAHENPADENLPLSSGKNVAFCLLPNINAPLKRILHGRKVCKVIEAQVQGADAVIIRGPAELGMMAAKAARKLGKPIAIEMSGCAFDHTWNHGSLLGKFYAPVKYLRARNMLKYADFMMYVTENFLQKRYPTRGKAQFASNVELPEPDETALHRRFQRSGPPIFGMIGNFNNNLKGLSVLFKAFSKIKAALPQGFEIRILGAGNPQKWEKEIACFGLEKNVRFYPPVPQGGAVFDWLDDIDIYLQPSLHEGLPRALIEAMSRGCPALASDAGGIPELLAPENIHKRGDANKLAQDILKSLSSDWRQAESRRNFEKAKDYTRGVLQPRREIFWREFKEFVIASEHRERSNPVAFTNFFVTNVTNHNFTPCKENQIGSDSLARKVLLNSEKKRP